MLKPVEKWVRRCPEVHSAVANEWGLDRIADEAADRFIEAVERKGRKALATPEVREAFDGAFSIFLKEHNQPLQVAMGGTEDLVSLTNEKWALWTKVTNLTASLKMEEAQNFKLRVRLHGNIDRRSSLLPGAKRQTPTEYLTGERTEGTER